MDDCRIFYDRSDAVDYTHSLDMIGKEYRIEYDDVTNLWLVWFS